MYICITISFTVSISQSFTYHNYFSYIMQIIILVIINLYIYKLIKKISINLSNFGLERSFYRFHVDCTQIINKIWTHKLLPTDEFWNKILIRNAVNAIIHVPIRWNDSIYEKFPFSSNSCETGTFYSVFSFFFSNL